MGLQSSQIKYSFVILLFVHTTRGCLSRCEVLHSFSGDQLHFEDSYREQSLNLAEDLRQENIHPPEFKNPIAGQSYNVFNDTHLPSSPFQQGNLQLSDTGFRIPQPITCKLEQRSSENLFGFDNKQAYIKHRLRSLGISKDISLNRFKGKLKPGFNVESISFKNDAWKLSATREFINFKFTLNNRTKFTQEFENMVKGLTVYRPTNLRSVNKWNEFFNKY